MATESTHLTKVEAEKFLDQLEMYMATLPYEGKTALEHASERKTMIDDLMSTQADTYYYNELLKETSKEKKAKTDSDIGLAIATLEKQLQTYKQTTSAKEAYFNILDDQELATMRPYVEYGGTHVYDTLKDITDTHAFKHVRLRPSNEYSNRLPSVVLEFVGNFSWSVQDPDNDHGKRHWFLSPRSEQTILLSTLTRGEPGARDFERTSKQVGAIQSYFVEVSAKRTKYKRAFFFLPHIKRRIDENVNESFDSKTQKLIRVYNDLVRAHARMEDLTEEEMVAAKREAQNEVKQVIALLNDRLGLNVSTDMDE